jgi:hypothetical protein
LQQAFFDNGVGQSPSPQHCAQVFPQQRWPQVAVHIPPQPSPTGLV